MKFIFKDLSFCLLSQPNWDISSLQGFPIRIPDYLLLVVVVFSIAFMEFTGMC